MKNAAKSTKNNENLTTNIIKGQKIYIKSGEKVTNSILQIREKVI